MRPRGLQPAPPYEARGARSIGLGAWVGLAAAALLAFALRALPFAEVFVDGRVLFEPADALYHVRRAFVTFEAFPRVLLRDAYVNFPGGATIPWPPLYDLLNALAARLLAVDRHGFETVMAWSPAVVGSLTVLPVFLLARRFASDGVAVGAAALYAVIPVAAEYARVGNPDHHVAVAQLGAWLLLVVVALVERTERAAPLAGLVPVLALLRVLLLFTWHGSLLYLALAEAVLIAAAALGGWRRLAVAHAASLALSLALYLPILAALPTPLLGHYSAIAPSRLHAVALALALAVSGLLALCIGRWPMAGPWRRFTWASVAALSLALLLGSVPALREGLRPAFEFGTMRDGVGALTSEQAPLYGFLGRGFGDPAHAMWGLLGVLIPLLPIGCLAMAWRSQERRAGWLVLAFWTASFGALTVTQVRYGNDLAPAAAVVFALVAAEALRLLQSRIALPAAGRVALVAVAVVAVFASPLRSLYLPQARAIFGWWQGEASPRASNNRALYAFLDEVRQRTPPTSGFVDDSDAPEYGIAAPANIGHAVRWVAQRPVPADNFWWFVGRENWDRLAALQAARTEREALRFAGELRARYFITHAGAPAHTFEGHLHRANGSVHEGAPAAERFRLVARARRGIPTLEALVRARPGPMRLPHAVPYKLFEIVEGAQIEVRGEAGETIDAETFLLEDGRRFAYRSQAVVDRSGLARMRVPHAGQYTLRSRQRPATWSAVLGDEAVRRGATVLAKPPGKGTP